LRAGLGFVHFRRQNNLSVACEQIKEKFAVLAFFDFKLACHDVLLGVGSASKKRVSGYICNKKFNTRKNIAFSLRVSEFLAL
jgi:hypothetical protein